VNSAYFIGFADTDLYMGPYCIYFYLFPKSKVRTDRQKRNRKAVEESCGITKERKVNSRKGEGDVKKMDEQSEEGALSRQSKV
jgi:hypothetical protein